nr:YihY/virulence factor BrkB family protein [Desulfobulbaceae bacterium]
MELDNDSAGTGIAAAAFAGIFAWIWKPPTKENSSPSSFIRIFLRIITIFFREFQRDSIPLRASALTFTIVLSLVPTLALGTAVLKGLGAGDQMRQAAYRFIDQLDSGSDAQPDVLESDPDGPLKQQAGPSPEKKEVIASQSLHGTSSPPKDPQLAGHLRRAADQIFDYVDKTDFAALGAFGVVGLVLAVLSVLGSIEKSMNVIWQTSRGRPFGRKLMDYLALMILLPLSVNLALATETMIQNQALFSAVSQIMPIDWLTGFAIKILPTVFVVGTFVVLYRFLPNTTVRMGPALVGGIVGGLCWFAVQGLYVKMQIGVARYNAIYGSFATLPLFLLWLNIAWIIFLAGAEASFACQVWRDYNWQRPKLSPGRELSLAFSLLDVIGADFKGRGVATIAELAERHPGYTPGEVSAVLDRLNQGGLIHHVDDEAQIGYVPASPVEEILPSEVVDLVIGALDDQAHPLARQFTESAKHSLDQPSTV